MSKPLNGCDQIRIKLEANNGSGLSDSVMIVTYCRHTLEGKDAPSIEHELLVRKACISCFALLDDVKWFGKAWCRTSPDPKFTRGVFGECMKELVTFEDDNKKKANLKRKNKGESSKFNVASVKNFLEDKWRRQNRMAKE